MSDRVRGLDGPPDVAAVHVRNVGDHLSISRVRHWERFSCDLGFLFAHSLNQSS